MDHYFQDWDVSADPELQKVLNVAKLLGRTAPPSIKNVKKVPMFNLLPTQIRLLKNPRASVKSVMASLQRNLAGFGQSADISANQKIQLENIMKKVMGVAYMPEELNGNILCFLFKCISAFSNMCESNESKQLRDKKFLDIWRNTSLIDHGNNSTFEACGKICCVIVRFCQGDKQMQSPEINDSVVANEPITHWSLFRHLHHSPSPGCSGTEEAAWEWRVSTDWGWLVDSSGSENMVWRPRWVNKRLLLQTLSIKIIHLSPRCFRQQLFKLCTMGQPGGNESHPPMIHQYWQYFDVSRISSDWCPCREVRTSNMFCWDCRRLLHELKKHSRFIF